MKKSLLILATAGLTLAPLFGADEAQPPAADALLWRVLVEPGGYSQMCFGRVAIGRAVPLPIYQFVLPGEWHVSAANLAVLRARRAEIVPELRKYLAATTMTGPLYEIVLGLNAVETLPDFLRIESAIYEQMAPDAPASGEGVLSNREMTIVRTRVMHRDSLSIMLQLLRQQRYQPVLDSPFEKTYAEALKAAATQEDFKGLKTPADAVAKGKPWVRFDPIYDLPIGQFRKPLEVPYTAEVRAQVRGFAEEFLKTVPPEKWLVTPAN